MTTGTVAKLKIKQEVEDKIYGLSSSKKVVPLDRDWTWSALWHRAILKQSLC